MINTLQGEILTVKVPFKNDKIACKVVGNKTLYDLIKGDNINVMVEYCGVWNVNNYCGPSWKLISLDSP